MQEYLSQSEEDTQKIAGEFLTDLPKDKNIICLFGDLGAGKTVFVKGLAKALEIDNYSVKSPTYTFIREYIYKKWKIYHVDLYRLDGPDPILFDQIEEKASEPNSLVIIEWAEKLGEAFKDSKNRVDICFEYVGKESRKITVF